MKTNTKTIIEVDSNDIDLAVTAFLLEKGILNKPDPNVQSWEQKRVNYESVAEQEWNNDSNYSFTVEPNKPDEDDAEDIAEGKLMWKLSVILDWMCLEGVIEKGDYLISVYW